MHFGKTSLLVLLEQQACRRYLLDPWMLSTFLPSFCDYACRVAYFVIMAMNGIAKRQSFQETLKNT